MASSSDEETGSQSNKFPCPHCDKIFRSPTTRLTHIEQFHDVEGKDEICTICGAHFTKRSHVRKHVAQTHAKRMDEENVTQEEIDAIMKSTPYACTYEHCDKKFPTEGQLQKHLARHKDLRHLCGYPACGKFFAFRKELQSHLNECHRYKAYDGDEDDTFRCPICPPDKKPFVSLTQLQTHLREQHVKETQLFRCSHEGCMKAYNKKGNLADHVRKVHGSIEEQYKFQCDKCSKKYKIKAALTRHIKNVHGDGEDSHSEQEPDEAYTPSTTTKKRKRPQEKKRRTKKQKTTIEDFLGDELVCL